jgi:hypothetical protein
MAEIQAYVDAGQSVSYRGAQQFTNMSPVESRAILSNLADKKGGNIKKTCVQCSTSGDTLSFSLVAAEDAETDAHVYSVQRNSSAEVATAACAGDIDRFLNMIQHADLSSQRGREDIVKFCGPITFANLQVNKRAPVMTPAPRAPHMPSSASKKAGQGVFKQLASSASKTSSSSAKKSDKAVASYFSKSASGPPKAEKKAAPQTLVKVQPTSAPLVAAAVADTSTLDVNSDEEWDDGVVINKDKLKERAPDFNAPKGTGGMSESDVLRDIEEDADADDDAAAAAAAAEDPDASRGFKVHGAMDDFVDDERIRAEAAGDLPKKKKRRMVEKMVVDDKGYMVTSYEEEWVTDDENSPAKPMTAAKRPAPRPAAKPATKKAAKAAPSGQKGMASFFSKK